MNKLFNTSGSELEKTSAKKRSADIAIIGMAGRIGQAHDLTTFWNDLLDKKDFVNELPRSRKKDLEDYFSFRGIEKKSYRFKDASFFPGIDNFDHSFFNISLAEAQAMNPDQRILLETTWHAVEDAGYTSKIRGSRTGIYLGYAREDNHYFQMLQSIAESSAITLTGNVSSLGAGRIAYFLDLKGPSMLINTACSSSLVAIHQACRGIRQQDCEMALVAGCNVALTPLESISESNEGLGVESVDGRTRSFDDNSSGTGGGEGCVVFLLKDLHKALQDGDRIHAVVKGSAVNQDGSALNIASPNVSAQKDVIISAWKDANINPSMISFIEAHGTGTPLGDPIEVAALSAAFRTHTDRIQFCAIGSVKSNIGHLDAAAGIAGVVKAVLSLKNRTLAPTLHFDRPNRNIPFEDSPLYVNTKVRNLTNASGPILCGVSSFGVSGTNAHVVLEEAPAQNVSVTPSSSLRIFVLSSQHLSVTRQLVEKYVEFISSTSSSLDDICYSASVGRSHFSNRIGFLVSDKENLHQMLRQWLAQDKSPHANGNSLNKTSEHNHTRNLTAEAQKLTTAFRHGTPNRGHLETILSLYIQGATIAWEDLFANEKKYFVSLPLYPFKNKRCWPDIPVRTSEQITKQVNTNPTAESEKLMPSVSGYVSSDQIFSQFRDYFVKNFDLAASAITHKTSLYEIGLDSISMVQVKQLIKRHYGIDITIVDLFRKYSQLGSLVDYISQQVPQSIPNKTTGVTLDKNLYDELSHIRDRIDSLLPAKTRETSERAKKQVIYSRTKEATPSVHAIGKTTENESLSTGQLDFLERFAKVFNERTRKSLSYTFDNMAHFANNRNVSGFKRIFKKLHYTIIADRSQGSRLWDIDGNEYIDFAMGFGVFFLGHNHPIIRTAVENQLSKGAFLGPLSVLPGEVALLISQIAKVERVAFYNSGTEAVMVAIRLARAATGKNKIVIFSGAYHGMFDGVLVQRNDFTEVYESVPIANGIPPAMAEDVYVLEYDDPQTLIFIESHHDEIAAVLVEPVQSRRPQLQPKEFLKELRQLTLDRSICLLFDEIITGFRIRAGGAQEYYNIEADLVTYGKVAGGGLPLGIVAGKKEFMMGIDGGIWSTEDNSFPRFDHRRTLVAGTFCHHPLAMASAKAMLSFIKDKGPALYEQLNRLTSNFVDDLNLYFEQELVPIRIYHCGSIFRFDSSVDLKLFFLHLLHKGIYVWEGATFFMSTEHRPEDLVAFKKAIHETVSELRDGGFMSRMVNQPTGSEKAAENQKLKLTEEQLRIFIKLGEGKGSAAALNETIVFPFTGKLDEPALDKSLQEILSRHPALRTICIDDKEQTIANHGHLTLEKFFVQNHNQDGAEQAHALLRKQVNRSFSPENGLLIRALMINYDQEQHLIALIINQIIADGFSLSLIQGELLQLYTGYASNTPVVLPEPAQVSSYQAYLESNRRDFLFKKTLEFWKSEWAKPDQTDYIKNPLANTAQGTLGWINYAIPAEIYDQLKDLGKRIRSTPFAILLTSFVLVTGKKTGKKNVLVGIPSVGQLLLDNPYLVGQCMQMLPFQWMIDDCSFESMAIGIRDKIEELQLHRNFTYSDILKSCSDDSADCFIPSVRIVFNMDPPVKSPDRKIVTSAFEYGTGGQAKYDLFVNLIEVNKTLSLSFQYNSLLFSPLDIESWITDFCKISMDGASNPSASIAKHAVNARDFKVSGESTNIPRALFETIRQESTTTELFYNSEKLDFEKISDQVSQVYHTIKDFRGNPIFICQTLFEAIAVSMACELTGHDFITVSPDQYISEPYLLSHFSKVFSVKELPEHQHKAELFSLNRSGVTSDRTSVRYDLMDSLSPKSLISNSQKDLRTNHQAIGEALGLPELTSIWLYPGRLSWTELEGWIEMAAERNWILKIVDVFPFNNYHRDPWVLCGDYNELLAIPRQTVMDNPPTAWIIITTAPLSTLSFHRLNFSTEVTTVHQLFRPQGTVQTVFYKKLNVNLTYRLDVIPVGKPLAPFSAWCENELNQVNEPNLPGHLYFENGHGHPIQTGFCASISADSVFTIWSTSSDAISLGTFTVENSLIVDAALLHPSVNAARLTAYNETQPSMEHRVLEIESDNDSPTAQSIEMFLKLYLPYHLIPSQIHWNGQLAERRSDTGFHWIDKSLEGKVLGIVRRILRNQKVSLTDNFYELGGSSIEAIHLVSILKSELNLTISPSRLFSATSLAEALHDGIDQVRESDIVAVSKRDKHPLSHAQQRFWIVEQIETGVNTGVLSETRTIFGSIDEAAFHASLHDIVKRHESLRSVFFFDQEPSQRIRDIDEFVLDYQYIDLASSDNASQEAQQIRLVEMQKPFDLTKDSLLKIRLIKLKSEEHMMLLFTHHIIFDGWSFDVFMRDLLTFYKINRGGSPSNIRPLPIQFVDYCHWHNQLIAKQMDVLSKFWNDKLFPLPMPVAFAERPRPRHKLQEANKMDLVLSAEVTSNLVKISVTQRATLFMTLQASLLALVYCVTKQSDVCIGSPVADRSREELHDMIGCLLNTVVMRTSFDREDSFLELQTKVKDTCLDAFKNQHYPFELLLKDNNSKRDLSRNPIFDIGFTFDELTYVSDIPDSENIGISSVVSEPSGFTVKSDWWFHAINAPTGIAFTVLYDRNIYSETYCGGLLRKFKLILETVSIRPIIPMTELSEVVRLSDETPETDSISKPSVSSIRKSVPRSIEEEIQ